MPAFVPTKLSQLIEREGQFSTCKLIGVGLGVGVRTGTEGLLDTVGVFNGISVPVPCAGGAKRLQALKYIDKLKRSIGTPFNDKGGRFRVK
jgi:hypothetical protein